MKIWYLDSDPTKVISIGKDSGEIGESYFDHLEPNPNGGFMEPRNNQIIHTVQCTTVIAPYELA